MENLKTTKIDTSSSRTLDVGTAPIFKEINGASGGAKNEKGISVSHSKNEVFWWLTFVCFFKFDDYLYLTVKCLILCILTKISEKNDSYNFCHLFLHFEYV